VSEPWREVAEKTQVEGREEALQMRPRGPQISVPLYHFSRNRLCYSAVPVLDTTTRHAQEGHDNTLCYSRRVMHRGRYYYLAGHRKTRPILRPLTPVHHFHLPVLRV
jgi:hypothetical protein